MPLSTPGAELLFEVFSERHERGSTIVTSNLPLDEWTGRQAAGEVGHGQRRRPIQREGVTPDHARDADESRDSHERW